jgi:uncharacterized membrane protein YkoI
MSLVQGSESNGRRKKLLIGGVIALLCLTFVTTGALALRFEPKDSKVSNPCPKVEANATGQKHKGDPVREELESKERQEAAKQAKITLDQAIQIASSQQPGRAVEGSLRREGDTILYRVVILPGDESRATQVFVNALDGKVVSVQKEEI